MKGLFKYLSPFSPDQSGAVSVLFELGGIIVICDAGGCAGNVCGFDEPRFFLKKSAVFSACLRDMDAIMGRDDKLVEKISCAVASYDARFVAVVGTPVPSVIGTDYKALRHMIEKKIGLPALCINTNGMESYDCGEEKAYMTFIETFCNNNKSDNKSVEKFAGVWGATPLDLPSCDSAAFIREQLAKKGMRICTYGMDSSFDDFINFQNASINYVVSPSGMKPAKYLHEKYGTPYMIASPVNEKLHEKSVNDVCDAIVKCHSQKVLIVHQQFLANSIRNMLRKRNSTASFDVATFFSFVNDFAEKCDVRVSEEDEFRSLVADREYDVIIADPLFKRAVPDFSGLFIGLPHFAVSGQLYAPKTEKDLILK